MRARHPDEAVLLYQKALELALTGDNFTAEEASAMVIEAHPIALQLRYLQTLLELGASASTTIAFPVPIEMLKAFAAYGEGTSNS